MRDCNRTARCFPHWPATHPLLVGMVGLKPHLPEFRIANRTAELRLGSSSQMQAPTIWCSVAKKHVLDVVGPHHALYLSKLCARDAGLSA